MKKFALIVCAAALAVSSSVAFAGGPLTIKDESGPVAVKQGPKLSPLVVVAGGALLAAALFSQDNSSGQHGSNID